MSNYAGYLLKIKGVTLPNSMIRLDSWTSTPDRVSDLSSYVDSNGKLHRSTASHKRTTLSFETKRLSLDDKIALQAILPTSDKVSFAITYWNDTSNSYKTTTCYMVDPEFSIYSADSTKIVYNPIKIEFIEY